MSAIKNVILAAAFLAIIAGVLSVCNALLYTHEMQACISMCGGNVATFDSLDGCRCR